MIPARDGRLFAEPVVRSPLDRFRRGDLVEVRTAGLPARYGRISAMLPCGDFAAIELGGAIVDVSLDEMRHCVPGPPPFVLEIPGASRGKRPVRPVGKIRSVGGKSIVNRSDTQTVNHAAFIRMLARAEMNGAPPMSGAMMVIADLIFAIPSTWTKRDKLLASRGILRPTKKPDVDNWCKLTFDAFNGIVWTDDKNVVDARVTKRFGDVARQKVTVQQIYGA